MTPPKQAKAKARRPEQTGPRWDRSTAEEIFAAYFTLRGFDVERFDTWLASLVDCGAKVELTERRELAIAAFQNDPDNKDSTLRHMEWIQRRWTEIRREEFLLPLARTGMATKTGGKKGADRSKVSRRGKGSKRAKIIAEAVNYSGPKTAKVATLSKKTGATERYVRKVLRNSEP